MSRFLKYKLYSEFINEKDIEKQQYFLELESRMKDLDILKSKRIYHILDCIDLFCINNNINYKLNQDNKRIIHIAYNYLFFLELIIQYAFVQNSRNDHLDEFKKFFIRIMEVAFSIKDEEFNFCNQFFDEKKDFFQILFVDEILIKEQSFADNVLLFKADKKKPEIRLFNNFEKAYSTTTDFSKVGRTMNDKLLMESEKNLKNLSKFLLYKDSSKTQLGLVYRCIAERKKSSSGSTGSFNIEVEELDTFKGKISDKLYFLDAFIKGDIDFQKQGSNEQLLDLRSSTSLSIQSEDSNNQQITDSYNQNTDESHKINSKTQKLMKKDRAKQSTIEKITGFAITKKNLKLPSSYNIPPYQLTAEFLKFGYAFYKSLAKKEEQSIIPAELSIITLSIVLGIHASQILRIVLDNNDTNSIYLNSKNQLKIKLTTPYGSVKDFNAEIFEDTKKSVLLDLPSYVIETINHLKIILPDKVKEHKEINTKFLSDFLTKLVKKFSHTITIKIDYLHLYSFYYWDEIKKSSNLAHFFLMKKNDNIHSQLAYLATNERLINYSLWIDELAKLLEFNKFIDNYSSLHSIEHSMDYAGTNRFIKGEKLKSFLTAISKVRFSQDMDTKDDYNVRMIFIRYLLCITLATRSYNQSCSLYAFLSSEKKLFIHEKAKTQYIGKRIIPLSDLAYLTIKYFYNIKEKLSLDYYEPILFIEDKVEELKQDTCLKWLENKKEILLKTYSSDFYNNLRIFIYSVDFDIGRYVFESYAHNKFRMKQEFIDAFLNHSESGTEDQAMYNVFNNDIYTAEVLEVIHKIEKDYLPNYSTILNEIKGL